MSRTPVAVGHPQELDGVDGVAPAGVVVEPGPCDVPVLQAKPQQ